MTKSIKFSWQGKDFTISEGKEPLVISEAGVNHNGDILLARELIDLSKEAGADIVKFQNFLADELATPSGPSADYIKRESPEEKSWYGLLKKLELTREATKNLIDHCKAKNIVFLSTPYDKKSADILDELGVPMFKIASTDTTNLPFIEYVAKKGKPMIVSTGLSTLEEAKEAVEACRRGGNDQIIIMQCTSNYPASIEAANIKVIDTFRKKLGVLVGYSDHTNGELCAILAASQGAVIFEKHFTKNKELPGPDQRASANPEEMKTYVRTIHDAYKALGDGIKRVTPEEEPTKPKMQKSITSTRAIKQGETISESDVRLRRPATGIPPKRLNEVIGKKAARDIKADIPITEDDIIF